MAERITSTLRTPGAVLTYDVGRSDPPGGRVLMMIGSPMGAAGFASLAAHFPDRTVVTYDPRGVERSRRDDPTAAVTPETHADDVRAIIGAIGESPVDLFASSGGAVNALALVAADGETVRTLVAHEPPLLALLPDAGPALAACAAIRDTYERRGWGAGMAHFFALMAVRGPVPRDFAAQPPPEPTNFGLRADDDGSRDDLMLGSNIVTITRYQPDVERLRTARTRIVIGVGAESNGEIAHRGGLAMAELLGASAVTFPGGHGGFVADEHGQTGAPDAFARRLREVLD
jgi:pimeloyl-ACP methyl ester carboxylesterase